MQWHTQAGNITTNSRVRIDFAWPELSVMKIVMWKCHVDDSNKARYDIVLGVDILTEMGLNLKFCNHVIEGYDRPFKGSTTPVVDMVTHEFTYFKTGKITPEEFFMNAYPDEVYESEQVCNYTKLLLVILKAKH